MAQVSIQYALDCPINEWDEKRIHMILKEITAIHHVALNCETGILCVDFNDQSFSEKELTHRIKAMNYPAYMIDAIMF